MSLIYQRIYNQLFYKGIRLFPYTLLLSIAACNILMSILLLNTLLGLGYYTEQRCRRKKRLFVLFISFYVLGIVGMLYSEDYMQALTGLRIKLPLVFLPIIFYFSPKVSKDLLQEILRHFVYACALSIFIKIGYIAYHVLINADLSFLSKVRELLRLDHYTYTTFSEAAIPIHPAIYAVYLSFSIYILGTWLYDNAADYSSKKKIMLLFLLFLFSTFIILLASRGIIIPFIFFSLFSTVFMLWKRRATLNYWLVFLGASVMAMCVILNSPMLKHRLFDQVIGAFSKDKSDEQNSIDLRKMQYYCTLQVIKAHPLLGVGTGDLKPHLQACYATLEDWPEGIFYDAHNQFLQTTAKLGIVGILLLITMLLYPTLLAFKQEKFIYCFLLLFLSAAFMTDTYLEGHHSNQFYAFFNALFAFHYLEENSRSRNIQHKV